MKRAIPILLACVGALSCSDEKSVTAPPDNSPGELSVTLTVTGDPTAGLVDYPVFSDQREIGRIKPGETVKFQLDGHSHVITLRRLIPAIFGVLEKELWWCQPTTTESISVQPTSSHPVSITFVLNCPPLDGEAEISLRFPVPEIWSDSTLAVHLYRQSAASNVVSFEALPSKDNVIRLSPGVYSVDARNSRCEIFPISGLADDLILVRREVTLTYNFLMDCR